MTISGYEPEILTAGDTWTWRRDDLAQEYPASSGWSLVYTLINSSGKIDITASADGNNFLITVLASVTAGYAAGEYVWSAHVIKGIERHTVRRGTLTIKEDIAAQTTHDGRSHARVVLDSIEAIIAKRATKDQEGYTIDGRRLDRTPIGDLLTLRDRYKAMVMREERAEKLARGESVGGQIVTRFGGLR